MTRAPLTQPLGQHAGRAIADLITRVVTQSRAAVAPAEAETKRRMVEGMMDSWEVEIGRFAGQLIEPMMAIEDRPAWLDDMHGRAIAPQHQTDFILSLLVGIGGVFSLITQGGAIVWRDVFNRLYKENPDVPLSAPDAADAVERNILDQGTAAGYAAQSGYGAAVFDTMVKLTGEPPGIVDMLRLWRRGVLDENTLDVMIAYSRIRTEWTPIVKELAYDVLPAADVIEGYIKGQIDRGQALTMWQAAGGLAADFDVAAATAGNPIGVEAANRLFNHGLIDDAELTSVILHSRINPQFEAMAKLLRFQYLSAFQIERALTSGTVTAQEATTWLLEDGYPPDQVAGLVTGATTAKAVKAKDASESLVLDTYEAGLITQAQAVAELGNLGYHPDEAAIVLEAFDARRILAITNQGVTVVRRMYLAGLATPAQASGDLDALGVHAALRDHYLALWAVERKAEVKTLSMAQVGDLFKKGIISAKYAVAQWVNMGYPQPIAQLLLYNYGAPTPGGGPVI